MNIALKMRAFCKQRCFFYNRIYTTRYHPAPLVKGDGAKVTRAETPAVLVDRKLNLLYGGHSPVFFVNGVVIAFKRQFIYRVKLLLCKSYRRAVLHHVFIAVLLHKRFTRYLILILKLLAGCVCVGGFIA